ncbi:NEDD4-binding protein 2-like 1 [Conger conger]|uniref:NEDD4-binding protein 2-like 1 n=1 Tax=Conger conger TaxID=82655 RepID=UPI002A59B573|nr:NEDD4-binding protein 2-like 1 [Conger conger]
MNQRQKKSKMYLGFGDSPDLFILRGLPGSKKSQLAREINALYGHTGVILSTDDFFIKNRKYNFDYSQLAEAHAWNQDRAWDAIDDNENPIIIDNTNMRFRDMRRYVEMGCNEYYITFKTTPDTFWCSVEELHKRANCGIPISVMYRMKENYRRAKNIYQVLNGSD